MQELISAVYRAFDPRPLEDSQRCLYVDLDEARGSAGLRIRLARHIGLADRATCQVLSGHRGSGKSTELRKLQSELQEPGGDAPKIFVVYCRADDDIDRNDVDFPEILIAVIRQTAARLKEVGISLSPGYFKDRFERLKSLLGAEIELDKFDLSVGLAKFSGVVKNSPDARQKLRRFLEPDTSNWLHAANDVIGEAQLKLKEKGYADLVIVVDDLDKMVQRVHDGAGCPTTEYLFVHRSAQLTGFQCHMIYTMPLELAYSHLGNTIAGLYGGRLPVVPMTKLQMAPGDTSRCPVGMRTFREVVAKRLHSALASEAQVFESESVRDDLIALSGGQPTELMTLVREAIVFGGLPLGSKALERAKNEGRGTYLRHLRPEHRQILDDVRKPGDSNALLAMMRRFASCSIVAPFCCT